MKIFVTIVALAAIIVHADALRFHDGGNIFNMKCQLGDFHKTVAQSATFANPGDVYHKVAEMADYNLQLTNAYLDGESHYKGVSLPAKFETLSSLEEYAKELQENRYDDDQVVVDTGIERFFEDSENRLETLTENGIGDFPENVPSIGSKEACTGECGEAKVLVELLFKHLYEFHEQFKKYYKNHNVHEIKEADDAFRALLNIFTSKPYLNILDLYNEFVITRSFFLEKIKYMKSRGLLFLEAAEEALEGYLKEGIVGLSVIHQYKPENSQKVIYTYDNEPEVDLDKDFEEMIKEEKAAHESTFFHYKEKIHDMEDDAALAHYYSEVVKKDKTHKDTLVTHKTKHASKKTVSSRSDKNKKKAIVHQKHKKHGHK